MDFGLVPWEHWWPGISMQNAVFQVMTPHPRLIPHLNGQICSDFRGFFMVQRQQGKISLYETAVANLH